MLQNEEGKGCKSIKLKTEPTPWGPLPTHHPSHAKMIIINTEHTSGIPEETVSEDSQKGVTTNPLLGWVNLLGTHLRFPPAGYSQTPHWRSPLQLGTVLLAQTTSLILTASLHHQDFFLLSAHSRGSGGGMDDLFSLRSWLFIRYLL